MAGMPVVDYESAWFALKARIVMKRSHSARELAESMAEIEVDHVLPEGQSGFDDRPLPGTKRSSSSPAGGELASGREQAAPVSS